MKLADVLLRAGSGIDEAIAKLFAAEGSKVALIDRDAGGIERWRQK